MADRSWRMPEDEPDAPGRVYKRPSKRPRNTNVGSGSGSGTGANITPHSDYSVPVRPIAGDPMSGQGGASAASGSSSRSGKPRVKFSDAITAKVHQAIVDWYLRNGEAGIKFRFLEQPKHKRAEIIKRDLEVAIRHEVDGPEFSGDRNLAGFDFWVKNKAQNGIFNLKQMVENMFPEGETGQVLSPRVVRMREIFLWWDPVAKGLSKTASKIIPWKAEKLEKWLRVSGPCQLLWIPDTANVVTLRSMTKVGGYGEVRKVRIEGDDRLPPEITWAEKTPKTSDRQKARIQVSAEACVLKSTHPGFIKFWLINSVSNAGYTLWWNGGTLREMFVRDRAHRPNANILTMGATEWQLYDQVQKFRAKRVKLAWALLWIMEALHDANVQHNDLSIDNIMLHWESDGSLKIGVCDWGCATHSGEEVLSLWHAETVEAKEKLRREKFWVAPEMFYIQNRRHKDPDVYYTKEAECYAVGVLARQLCNDGDDRTLFADEGRKIWDVTLNALTCENVSNRVSLTNAKLRLQMQFVGWDEPIDCWRTEVKDSVMSV